MRILILSDYTLPAGGAELMTLMLRDGLRRRGHEVKVLGGTGYHASLWPSESFADETCMTSRGRMQALTSVWNLSARSRLKRMIKTFNPDLVHVMMFLWQLSPAILELLRDIPSVYQVMTYKPVCLSGMKQFPDGSLCHVKPGSVCLGRGCVSPLRWPLMMLQYHLWRNRRDVFDVILSPSRAVTHELESVGLGPVRMLPNGCVIGDQRPPLMDPPLVVYIGRLTREKGIDTLIRAFASLPEPPPGAELWIGGIGPEGQNLQKLAEREAPGGSIRFLGGIEHARLDQIIDRAWVQAVPSTWAEPFGLVVIESLARGTAVIASDLGGPAEIITHEETGLLAPPGDVGAWREAIGMLLSDREKCERMGAAGRQRARTHYDIELHFDALESIYEELTGSMATHDNN